MNEIFKISQISRKKYEDVLEISDDDDCQIHYKISQDSCFVSNYFRHELLAWELNMDIQPAFNQY